MRRLAIVALLLLLVACTTSPGEPTAPPTQPPTATVPVPTVGPVQTTTAAPNIASTSTASQTLTPSSTPSPAPSPLPPAPAQVTDVPQAILTFLNSAPRNVERLKPLLSTWGWNVEPLPYAPGSDVVMSGDVNGDGQMDMAVALGQSPPSSCETGAIILYLADGSRFRMGQQIGLLGQVPIDPRISHIPCPTIFAVRDLIRDGRSQIVFTSTNCGAHTCNVTVGVLRWDLGDLRPVMSEPLPTMAYPEVTLEPNPQNGQDIVMHGGIIGSVGAGPQRERREIYRWNGSRFVLAQRSYDPSNYLYFIVLDANSAMRQGDLATAIRLYQAALNDPTLELSGLHPSERTDLQAFARFRLLVAYTLTRDQTNASEQFNALAAGQPRHIYYEVAKTFQDAFVATKDIDQACAAVTNLAQTNMAITAPLSAFGYANADLAPEEVCK